MEQLTARLLEFWQSLTTMQRTVVIGIPALLIIGAVTMFTALIGAPPTQTILFADVDPADAAMILEELEKQNVAYDLLNDGRDIAVPASQVHRLRISLASQGLPRGHVGFEMFDTVKMGITDQGMQIDRQRATQGELARTLESLEQVDQAKVIIVIAPDTSFLDTDTRSTASVTLSLLPGEHLNKLQVEGIRHLVSRAVRRLAPEDVTIMDSRATPLTGQEDQAGEQALAGMDVATLQHELRQRIERRHEDKIRQVLEGPYGRGNVAPSVTIQIDFTRIHSQSKEYTPVTGDEQGIESRVEEHRSSTTAAEDETGGVPGTTSNVPGYLGFSGSENTGVESSEYDLIVDYLVNERLSEEELWPGAITKRSAAVTLNSEAWDQTIKSSVEELVARAIGADLEAGDAVYVQAFPWSKPEDTEVQAKVGQVERTRTITTLATLGAIVLLIVFGLLFLRSLVFGGLPRQTAIPAAAGVEAAAVRPGIDMTEEEAEEFALRRLDELGTTQQEKMRQEVSRMIDTDPERVVALIRSWLMEDT